MNRKQCWWKAVTTPSIWRQALLIGGIVGFLQVMVNQGDAWLRFAVTPALVAKTIVTPLIAFSVALLSAVAAHANREPSPNTTLGA